MIAALAELECTAVIAGGVGKDVASFGPQPPHLRLVEWIAQPLLLECCDLFVTHGGFNSVRESLRLGIPMVVVPVMGDQPYNAARCAEVGVARALPGMASPAALRTPAARCLEIRGFGGERGCCSGRSLPCRRPRPWSGTSRPWWRVARSDERLPPRPTPQ